MSELESRILRHRQTPPHSHVAVASPLQVCVNGRATGPTHLRQEIAGTERLAVVPCLRASRCMTDTEGDGMLNCNELTVIVKRPIGAWQQAVPRLILSDARRLSAIGDEVCFAKPDLFVFGASAALLHFQRQLHAAVVAAQVDPSNVAEGLVIGSVPLPLC